MKSIQKNNQKQRLKHTIPPFQTKAPKKKNKQTRNKKKNKKIYICKGVTWHVFDRYTGETVATFVTKQAFMYYHWINCFEEMINAETNEINVNCDITWMDNSTVFDALYVDNLIYNWQYSMDLICTTQPVRFIMPLNNSDNIIKYIPLTMTDLLKGSEFATINYAYYNGKKYNYSYMAAVNNCNANNKDRSQFWDAIAKLDVSANANKNNNVKIFHLQNQYFGEPIFIPNPNQMDVEDSGVVASGFNVICYIFYHFFVVWFQCVKI